MSCIDVENGRGTISTAEFSSGGVNRGDTVWPSIFPIGNGGNVWLKCESWELELVLVPVSILRWLGRRLAWANVGPMPVLPGRCWTNVGPIIFAAWALFDILTGRIRITWSTGLTSMIRGLGRSVAVPTTRVEERDVTPVSLTRDKTRDTDGRGSDVSRVPPNTVCVGPEDEETQSVSVLTTGLKDDGKSSFSVLMVWIFEITKSECMKEELPHSVTLELSHVAGLSRGAVERASLVHAICEVTSDTISLGSVNELSGSDLMVIWPSGAKRPISMMGVVPSMGGDVTETGPTFTTAPAATATSSLGRGWK